MTQNTVPPSPVDPSLALIDRIENLLVSGVRVPMTSKVMLNEEDLFDLLDQLRESLPQEFQQAQQVLSHQAEILQEARKSAEKILQATKEKAKTYLQESELLRQAQKAADETRRAVEDETKKQRFETDKYSEQVLADLEEKVNHALSLVQAGRQNLAQNIEETAQKMGV
ncbi:MAG: hypothetical protein IGS03_04095 [Candidatus Sericytochromatia bacterium]|nr:hypothetical protein [Candidatus Sericytochromatia bacterium]